MPDAASRAYGLSRETKGSVALRRAPVDVPRPRWWVIFLLRILLGLYLPRAYRLVVRGDRQAMKRRGPFILVGNHQNFRDPFLVGLHMREVPQFVTSDNIFRGGFFSRVMTGVGSIPISKYMRNSDTIRMISGVLKRGGVVGMYPESDRTYDGRSLPVRPEVVKLIRMMRVPVIGVHQRGGFLSGPKWGPHRRRGRLELRYELLYDPEKEGDIALEELLERVRGVIEHDEMRAQRTDPVAFRSTRPAEGLERFLYACPVCGEFQTHVTEGDSMRCSACGHTTRMDEFGLLHPSTVPDRQEWDLLETWSAAQSKLLRQRITIQTASRATSGTMRCGRHASRHDRCEQPGGSMSVRAGTSHIRQFAFWHHRPVFYQGLANFDDRNLNYGLAVSHSQCGHCPGGLAHRHAGRLDTEC